MVFLDDLNSLKEWISELYAELPNLTSQKDVLLEFIFCLNNFKDDLIDKLYKKELKASKLEVKKVDEKEYQGAASPTKSLLTSSLQKSNLLSFTPNSLPSSGSSKNPSTLSLDQLASKEFEEEDQLDQASTPAKSKPK